MQFDQLSRRDFITILREMAVARSLKKWRLMIRDGQLLDRCGRWSSETLRALRPLLWAMALTGVAACPAPGADTADEARAINRQVLELIKASKLGEADMLAKRGLALCQDAGPVKVDCAGRFNEILGDIGYAQARYADALAYYEQALRVRDAGPGGEHLLIPRLHLRIGRAHLALQHDVEAEAALKKAVAGFERLAPTDRELGAALTYLQQTYFNAGRYEEAIAVGRRALEAIIVAHGAGDRAVLTQKLGLGTVLQSAGKIDEAEALGRDTLAQADKLPATDPIRGWAARRMADVNIDRQNFAEAERLAKVAVAVEEKQVPVNQANLLRAIEILQRAYRGQERYDELRVAARQARSIAVQAFGGSSEEAIKPLILEAWINNQQRQFAEAERILKQALTELPNAGQSRLGIEARTTLGETLLKQARYADAVSLLREALVASNEMKAPNDLRARIHLALGDAHRTMQRPQQAVAHFQEALDLYIAWRGDANLYALDAEDRLATAQIEAKDIDQARRHIEHEFLVLERIGSPSASAARVNKTFGMLLFTRKNYVGAEQALRDAIRLIDPPPAGRETTLEESLILLGAVLERQSRYAEAEAIEHRALDYSAGFFGPADPALPIILSNLAQLYENWRRPADSIPYALRTISLLDERKQENSTLGLALMALGRAHRDLRHYADAEAALTRARDVLDRVLPENDPNRTGVRIDIGHLRLSEEQFSEAEQAYQSAIAMAQEFAYSDTIWSSSSLGGLALVYREMARYGEAERLLLETVKLEEAGGEERKARLAAQLTALASVFRRQNRYGDAENALLRALALEQGALDRATTLNALGLVYSTTGRYQQAEPLLKEALAIRTKGLTAADTLTLESLGNLADIDFSMARYADAEAKLRDALRLAESLGPSQSTVIALHSAWLARVLIPRGKLNEAEALIRSAVGLYEQRLGSEHPRTGGALKTLASIELSHGREREAEAHYRHALAIDEKVIGAESPAVAADLLDLAPLLWNSGRWLEARASIERARRIMTANFEEDSPMCTGVILAQANMAYEAGQYGVARGLADRARQIQERTLGQGHPAIAATWILSGRSDIASGRLDEAETAMDHASNIAASFPEHPFNIDILAGKADLAWARGNHSGAERYGHQALAIAESFFGLDHPARGRVIDRLAGALWAQGKFAEAESLRRDVPAKAEQSLGADHPGTARAVRGLAIVLSDSARLRESLMLYERALAIDEQTFGPASREAAWDHLSLGSILRRAGQYEEARVEINRARTAWESQGNLLASASSLEQLAELAADEGAFAEGLVLTERVVGIAEEELGSDSPALAGALAQLGKFHLLTDRQDTAEKTLERIDGLIGKNPPEQAPAYSRVLVLRSLLSAERGDLAGAETLLSRAIDWAGRYTGTNSDAVGLYEFDRAWIYWKAERFQEAIAGFTKALEIFKRASGERAPRIGYALLGAAAAYAGAGDRATSTALFAAAVDILGPTIAAQRPVPRWL
jgi:tetratricopeptide (TPR) repeat protein